MTLKEAAGSTFTSLEEHVKLFHLPQSDSPPDSYLDLVIMSAAAPPGAE